MIVTDMREHPFEAETVEFAVEVDEKKAIGELLAAFWEKQKVQNTPAVARVF